MHFASMSLGILDFLIEWLTAFLIWIIGWVFDLIFLLFADLLFSVGTALLEIVDMIQLIFRKLSGLDKYYVVTTGTPKLHEGTDPLLSLMTNSTVVEVLTALTLVSIVMVIVAAIIKIIQSEFTSEGAKNSKGAIFGQALKSLMLFILVPICCIGGVGISNALLKTIDRATNLSAGNATLGSSIFVSAASNCNRVRCGGNWSAGAPYLTAVGYTGAVNDNNREEVAMLIDRAFKDNTIHSAVLFGGVANGVITGLAESSVNLLNGLAKAQGSVVMPGQYFYQSNGIVDLYYNIKEMNFITYIGAALLAAMTMLNVSFGMIMRMFKGVILYMISPPMVALMPLDGGSAFKSWRKNFIGQTLAAYGTIVALNLLFIALPVVDSIKLFGTWATGSINAGQDVNGINSFVSILVTLTGLFMIKDLTKLISDMIGADDAAASGAGMAQKVGSTVGKIGAIGIGGVAGLAGKGIGAALTKAGHAKAGAAFGNMGNKLFQNAKGTLGAAANKGIGSITGGAIKGHFSEETDYGKAMEAKKKKADAKAERLESGEWSMGDLMTESVLPAVGHGLSVAGKAVGRAPGMLIGGVSGMVGKAIHKENPLTGFVPGARQGAHISDNVGEFIGKSATFWTTPGRAVLGGMFGDGGAQKREDDRTRDQGNKALGASNQSVQKENEKVGTVLDQTSIDALVAALNKGKGGAAEASQQLAAMVAALEGIASKTEEQKDLIQKLTLAKDQVVGGIDPKQVLKALGGESGISAAVTPVAAESRAIASVMADVSIKTEVDAQTNAQSIAEQIAKQLIAREDGEGDEDYATRIQPMLDKMMKRILEAQKAELEKVKEEIK